MTKRADFATIVMSILTNEPTSDYLTIDEIKSYNTTLIDCNIQFMSSVLFDLIKEGKVERGTVKRKIGYREIR